MKHSNYYSHWEIFQDYCVYCGKFMEPKYGATCICDRVKDPHGIRRSLCARCVKEIRKEVENAGYTSTYILNMLENRRTHGEVIWD